MFQKVVDAAKLISLPDIYFKLKELIEDPDYTMAEVALLVGSDPAMATRFLRAVNNPLNRRACKIETVSHAISFLGIAQVHDIVLSASVTGAFEGIRNDVMNMKKFWHRSFYCAMVTRELALECGILECDRLFMTGLLHDIGHLFMYITIPDESQNAIFNSSKLKRPLHLVERALLGFDYAKMGGYMMQQWDLPESLQSITWRHTEPVKAKQYTLETALLHISAMLVRSDLEEGIFGDGAYAIDPTVWQTTDLSEQRCLDIRQASTEQFDEAVDSLLL